MKRILLTSLALGFAPAGCNWTDFDQLADTTWVHSEQKPNLGATDYAIAIVGATSDPNSGGRLAVISNNAPSYSTLEFDATGATTVGANPQKLGAHFIASLGEQPILVGDGAGKIALVEKAVDQGQIAVVSGAADSPADLPFASAAAPDAATFAGGSLIVAAGSNLFTLGGAAPLTCAAVDNTSAPLATAALAADATNLWVWSKSGVLMSYALADLAACPGGMIVPASAVFASSFAPGTGARVQLVGSFAVLAAHADKSTMGQVFVVDTTTLAQAAGSPLAAEGIRSAVTGDFAGKTYVALGFPDRAVDGVVTGQVELHALDPATGALTATPAEVLNDAQPEAGELFGRAVTTMKLNGDNILVVAANSEIFAYYRTALYPDVR